MKSPELKNPTLEDLVGQYVTWQGRLDTLETERPAVYARFLEQQQIAIDKGGNLKALQEAKQELQDHDYQMEASVQKLNGLWERGQEVITAGIQARRAAEPEIRAALDKEFQEKVSQAAALFVQALAITDGLQLDRAAVVKYLDLPGDPAIFGYHLGLQGAIDQARRQAPAPGITFRQKRDEFNNFLINSSGYLRVGYILQIFNREVLALGGRPVIHHRGAGDLEHEARKRRFHANQSFKSNGGHGA